MVSLIGPEIQLNIVLKEKTHYFIYFAIYLLLEYPKNCLCDAPYHTQVFLFPSLIHCHDIYNAQRLLIHILIGWRLASPAEPAYPV